VGNLGGGQISGDYLATDMVALPLGREAVAEFARDGMPTAGADIDLQKFGHNLSCKGRGKSRAQRIDVRRNGIDSLDVEIYDLVIIRGHSRGRRREGRLVWPRRERAGCRTSFEY